MDDMSIPTCLIFLHNVKRENNYFVWIICEWWTSVAVGSNADVSSLLLPPS